MSRPTPDDFKSKNKTVDKVFYQVINIFYKNLRKVYRYCHKEMNINITRLQEHLDKCKSYRDGRPPNDPAGGSQQTLSNLIAVMSQTKTDNWKRVDMTIYISNLLFNYYENKYVKDHFHYINPKYTLSNHKILSDHILNDCYDTVYEKINRKLQSSR